MRFTPTAIAGAWVIDPEPHRDERGSFARTWCARELAEHGVAMEIKQCSVSVNVRRGTLRGLHYQAAPHEEAKVVSCLRGAIYDVIVDLRPGSASFKRHLALELSAQNGRLVYVPPGVAHGFQTLVDDSLVHYYISQVHVPEAARGVRWDDPAFNIEWPPAAPRILSERDRSYGDFRS